jgi:2'-5' RNA ligase
MRLFVALEIPKATRETLAALLARIGPTCRGARWSRPEGMHLTLKFIGEVADERAKSICAELGAVCGPSAIEIDFRGAGFFPNARHPRVLWAGVQAGPNLAELAAEIDRRLEPLGIARERREFRPHLTLARFKSEDGLPTLQAALAALEKQALSAHGSGLQFGRGSFAEFHLIQSKLRPEGALYTTLDSFRFTATNPMGCDPPGARP